jgi:hypothetical protein
MDWLTTEFPNNSYCSLLETDKITRVNLAAQMV